MRRVVVLGLVVLGLVGAAKLRRHHAELLAVDGELEHQVDDIERTESGLDRLDGDIDASERTLGILRAKLDTIERAHPNGVPQALYPEYTQLVAAHNAAVAEHNALVARHDGLRGTYADRVDRHNARVGEAQSLAAESTACSLAPGWLRRWACDGGS